MEKIFLISRSQTRSSEMLNRNLAVLKNCSRHALLSRNSSFLRGDEEWDAGRNARLLPCSSCLSGVTDALGSKKNVDACITRGARFLRGKVGQDIRESSSACFHVAKVDPSVWQLAGQVRRSICQANVQIEAGREAERNIKEVSKSASTSEIVSEVFSKITSFSKDTAQICDFLYNREWEPSLGTALKEMNIHLSQEVVRKVLELQLDANVALGFYKWAGQQEGYTHDDSTFEILINKFINRPGGLQILLDDMKDGWKVPSGAVVKLMRKFWLDGNFRKTLELVEYLVDQQDKYSCDSLITALLRERAFHEAFTVYGKMSRNGSAPDEVTAGVLVSGLIDAGISDIAWSIFQERIDQGLTLSPTQTVNKLFQVMCKSKRAGEALAMLKKMKENSLEITVEMHESVIHGLCRAASTDEALRLFEEMKASSFPTSKKVYSILLDAFAKNRDGNTAWRLFQDMRGHRHIPDADSYWRLLEALCRGGQVSRALEIEKQLRDNGYTLLPLRYKCIFVALCEENSVNKAVALMKEVLARFGAVNASTNQRCSPIGDIFYQFIDALVNADFTDEAYDAFKEMTKAGFLGSQDVYCALICGLCKIYQVTQATELYHDMMEKGLEPSLEVRFLLTMSLCKKGMVNRAYEIFQKLNIFSHDRYNSLYRTLILTLCRDGQVDRAFRIFKLWQSKDVKIHASVCAQVLSCLFKAGKIDEGCELFRDIGSMHPTNDCIYLIMIDGMCKAGKLEKACEVFDDMQRKGMDIDLKVYSSLINGHMKQGNVLEACKIFEQLKQLGHIPNIIVYNTLIRGFCKAGLLEQAIVVLDEMSERHCQPDQFTYCILIDTLGKIGRVEGALQLFQKMKDDGCSPDVATYCALISGLGKAGRAKEAFKVFDEMMERGALRAVCSQNEFYDDSETTMPQSRI